MSEPVQKIAASLGEIVRRQRELSALSMRQFAAMAGISNPYLSQIERGLREPSEQVAESIAGVLRTSVDALYREAGVPDSAPSAVVGAITADEALTARQRQALLTTYEAFMAANGHARRRRRSRPSTGEHAPGGEDQDAAG